MAEDLDELFEDTAADDYRIAANRQSKRPLFHAGESNTRTTPFKDIWNEMAGELGITTKRMRADALAQAAQDELAWRDASTALASSLQDSRTRATNANDLGQLRTLETQLDAVDRLRSSSSPKHQEMGAALFGSVMQRHSAWEEKQETDRIAGETKIAEQKRLLGEERWSRFSTAYDDLHRESQDFMTIASSYRALQSAYSTEGEPGNVNDIAAINSVQRMIDPGVSVREGDVSLLQNYAGVPDWFVTGLNRVTRDGGRFDPRERAMLNALGAELMKGANAKQSETNLRFQNIGVTAELPEDYVGQLAIPLTDTGGKPELNFGEIPQPIGTSAENPRGAAISSGAEPDTKAQMIGSSLATGVETAVNQAFDVVEGATGYDPRLPVRLLNQGTEAVRGALDSALTGEDGELELPEVSESIETDERGTRGGVFVPRFMRRRERRKNQ